MKKTIFFFLCLISVYAFSQDKPESDESNTNTSKRFLIKLGANYVDSTGESNPFDFLTSSKELAFSSPLKIGVEYRFNELFSIGLDGSANKWKAPDAVIDSERLVEDQNYFAIDGKLNFYIDEAFNWFTKTDWLELYLDAGLGYFKVNGGNFSGNFGGGANIWISQKVGLNFDAVAKWVLDAHPERYNTNHFQVSASVIFRSAN